mgnify:CR=1 FL=1
MTVSIPSRLFHGTVYEFDSFEPGKFNGFTSPRVGIYLTDDLVTCREFGHLIYEVEARAKKVFDARDLYDFSTCQTLGELVDEANGEAAAIWERSGGNARRFVRGGGLQTAEMIAALASRGFDGMVFWDEFGRRGFESYVVFDPDQVQIVSKRNLSEVDCSGIHDYDWDAEAPEAGARP